MLPELRGSYEEVPTNLLDYAVRDRRWVQGNLQHARLIGERGLHWMSRLHLGMGIFAYLASPLWLAMLLLSSSHGGRPHAHRRRLFRTDAHASSRSGRNTAGRRSTACSP